MLPNGERGLFATSDLGPGTTVARCDGPIFSWSEVPESEVRYAMQVGDNRWQVPRSSMRFVNHSCTPNCALKDAVEMYTQRRVAAGEELTFSYDYLPATEWQRAPELYFWDDRWSFDCRCGAPGCVGRVDRYRIGP